LDSTNFIENSQTVFVVTIKLRIEKLRYRKHTHVVIINL